MLDDTGIMLPTYAPVTLKGRERQSHTGPWWWRVKALCGLVYCVAGLFWLQPGHETTRLARGHTNRATRATEEGAQRSAGRAVVEDEDQDTAGVAAAPSSAAFSNRTLVSTRRLPAIQ